MKPKDLNNTQRVARVRGSRIDIHSFIKGEGKEFEKIQKIYETRMKREKRKYLKDNFKHRQKAIKVLKTDTYKKNLRKSKKEYSIYGDKNYEKKVKNWARAKSRNLDRLIRERHKLD